MKAKIETTLNALRTVHDDIEKEYNDGIVEGFSKESAAQKYFQREIIFAVSTLRAPRSWETQIGRNISTWPWALSTLPGNVT